MGLHLQHNTCQYKLWECPSDLGWGLLHQHFSSVPLRKDSRD